MGWKIYFWFYAVVIVFSTLLILGEAAKASLGDWISSVNNWILFAGLYIYVFKKKGLMTKNIIRLILVNLILLALFMIDYLVFSENIAASILPSLKSTLGLDYTSVIIGILISLPMIYANFKLLASKK